MKEIYRQRKTFICSALQWNLVEMGLRVSHGSLTEDWSFLRCASRHLLSSYRYLEGCTASSSTAGSWRRRPYRPTTAGNYLPVNSAWHHWRRDVKQCKPCYY